MNSQKDTNCRQPSQNVGTLVSGRPLRDDDKEGGEGSDANQDHVRITEYSLFGKYILAVVLPGDVF